MVAAGAAGCGEGDRSAVLSGADASRAPSLVDAYGCGSCHTISSIDGANGKVGPPLDDFGDRLYIAGELPNTPENLVRWLMNPQLIEPGTVMPNMGVSREDARDLAAYLDGY
jgi:cytochrome c2